MVDDDGEDEDYLSSSDGVLVWGDAEVNRNFFRGHGIDTAPLRDGLRPWTDDYCNLFQILK